MLPYGLLELSQQKTQQMGDLDYWNRFRIQSLGKYVLSRILKACGPKEKT